MRNSNPRACLLSGLERLLAERHSPLRPFVLEASTNLMVGTGIANIYGRDPYTAAAAANTLAEAHPGRFVMGLGVSHDMVVAGLRGHPYSQPLKAMTEYLEGLEDNPYVAPTPVDRPPVVIAALGPKMLAIARTQASGALTLLVTPEHTKMARQVLGPDPLLAVEQTIVLQRDPAKARKSGAGALGSLPGTAQLQAITDSTGIRNQGPCPWWQRRLGRRSCGMG